MSPNVSDSLGALAVPFNWLSCCGGLAGHWLHDRDDNKLLIMMTARMKITFIIITSAATVFCACSGRRGADWRRRFGNTIALHS